MNKWVVKDKYGDVVSEGFTQSEAWNKERMRMKTSLPILLSLGYACIQIDEI